MSAPPPLPVPVILHVFNALDRALDNGYDLRTTAPLTVAADLVRFDAALDALDDSALLVPAIEAWQRSRQEPQPTIVAELSKNWINGESASPPLTDQFELLIDVNRARGYRLVSFQLHRMMTDPTCLNETIIAVFER